MAPEPARVPVAPPPLAAALEKDFDLYRQIVESAHEGIWIHDLAGRTTYANAQMAELLGYTVPEMYDITIFDLLDEAGKLQALELLARERRAPARGQVDCRYLRKDGSPVWCLVNHSPLRDSDGRHTGLINLIRDVTERKLLDQNLRHVGVLLAEAQRVAHLGSWSWEVLEDTITWSDELYRIIGVTRSEQDLTYQEFLDRLHPDDVDRVHAVVGGCLQGEPRFSYECRVVRPGGEVVWIHADGESISDTTGAVRSIRGTVLDITAYRRAQEEVQHTSSRYQLLQRMASGANEDFGFDEVLLLAVREILRHTKWPVGRAYLVSGSPPRVAAAPLAAPRSDEQQAEEGAPTGGDVTTALPGQVVAAGRPLWRAPVPYAEGPAPHSTDPGPRFQAGFAFPVLVSGEVVAVLEFLSDQPASRDQELLETCEQVGSQLARVVERRRAADDLAAARDAAMESLRAKSEFLAAMSHEIRTPMNGVIGLTNLLLDTPLDERQRQYAEGVHVSGEALLTVINDILDFSKLEAGKVELDYEDFEVRRIIEDVAALLGPQAYAKGLELLAYCLPDVPAVLVGDSGRIRQIVLNLVSNGVKFTGAGEVVTKVSATSLPEGAVNLRFEVRDTGIGIPEEHRGRLFESFSQADASTTRRYGGTGLGLAISRRLVAAMGGAIGFDSRVGGGSTFWFEIPLTPGTRVPEDTTQLPDLLADLRVLVVDDNATNRTILESQLGSWRMRPDVVDSAPAALAQLRSRAGAGEPYAIAVLDMCMPDMDGLQLAEQITADARLAGTRLIMLTSTSELEPARLSRAGVSDSLLKPVRNVDLHDRLRRLVAPPTSELPVESTKPPPPPGAPKSGRVLVVEDNPLNQLVAQGIVTSLGYAVDIVDNGAEALRAILLTSYVAVLMDCHMPVLDGFEATREIRRREGDGARLPVIAMTAGAMVEDRERCAAAGMDDFVSKPVTLAAVESALARRAHPTDQESRPPLPATSRQADRPAWDDEPALDLNRIAQLRQLGTMGGTDLLGRVVGLFARDGEASVTAIREAATAHSVGHLHEALHKLRGTSANLGANRVAALCRQLEDQTADRGGAARRTALLSTHQLHQLEIEVASAQRAVAQAV